jgi:hypothetical protein
LSFIVARVSAAAYFVVLMGGGRLCARIVERTATRVAIETGPGRVTLPMSRVEKILESQSSLEVFAERAETLQPGDVQGWSELARWAEQRDLLTQARLAWQRVLAQDPGNPEANAGVGRVALNGVWMSSDEAYRAQGYVSYGGRWLTPAEHEAAVRERAADEAAAWEAREAGARMREADARAREAEARARDAEAAAAAAAAYSGGIPLEYASGIPGLLLPVPAGTRRPRARPPGMVRLVAPPPPRFRLPSRPSPDSRAPAAGDAGRPPLQPAPTERGHRPTAPEATRELTFA